MQGRVHDNILITLVFRLSILNNAFPYRKVYDYDYYNKHYGRDPNSYFSLAWDPIQIRMRGW